MISISGRVNSATCSGCKRFCTYDLRLLEVGNSRALVCKSCRHKLFLKLEVEFVKED